MDRRVVLGLLALALLPPFRGSALAGGIGVRPPVLIAADEPGGLHAEVWLAENPRAAHNLVAAASLVIGDRRGVAIYASQDGGRSWQRAVHGTRGEKVFPGADPAVAFDADGDAFLCASAEEMAVWRSTDQGKTWGEPAAVPGAASDRTAIASDLSAGPYHARLYVAWTFPITVFGRPHAEVMAISRSDDRARSFSFPQLILPPPERQRLHAVGNVITTPEGKLIVPYQTYDWPEPSRAPLTGDHWILASDNGGRSFSEARHVARFRRDGQPGQRRSAKGASLAQIAVDSSAGPRRGRLYMSWLDLDDAGRQILVAASADGGKSWSSPVRVNDHPSVSDGGNPAITVNDDGAVGVVWNDRRNDPGNGCYQLFFSASVDGGASFLPNVEVTNERTCPDRPSHRQGEVDAADPARRFRDGGDTHAIVGRPDGAFQLAWLGGRGVTRLWSATVTLELEKDRPGPP